MDFSSSARAAENRTRWKWIVAYSSVVPKLQISGCLDDNSKIFFLISQ